MCVCKVCINMLFWAWCLMGIRRLGQAYPGGRHGQGCWRAPHCCWISLWSKLIRKHTSAMALKLYRKDPFGIRGGYSAHQNESSQQQCKIPMACASLSRGPKQRASSQEAENCSWKHEGCDTCLGQIPWVTHQLAWSWDGLTVNSHQFQARSWDWRTLQMLSQPF